MSSSRKAPSGAVGSCVIHRTIDCVSVGGVQGEHRVRSERPGREHRAVGRVRGVGRADLDVAARAVRVQGHGADGGLRGQGDRVADGVLEPREVGPLVGLGVPERRRVAVERLGDVLLVLAVGVGRVDRRRGRDDRCAADRRRRGAAGSSAAGAAARSDGAAALCDVSGSAVEPLGSSDENRALNARITPMIDDDDDDDEDQRGRVEAELLGGVGLGPDDVAEVEGVGARRGGPDRRRRAAARATGGPTTERRPRWTGRRVGAPRSGGPEAGAPVRVPSRRRGAGGRRGGGLRGGSAGGSACVVAAAGATACSGAAAAPSELVRDGVAGGGVPGRLAPGGSCCWNAVRTDCRCTVTGAVSCWSSSSGTGMPPPGAAAPVGGNCAVTGPPSADGSGTDVRISPHGSSSRTSSPGLCGPSSFGSERDDAERVEVVGHAGDQVGGRARGRRRRSGPAGSVSPPGGLRGARVGRPEPGEGGVEQPDQADGVGSRGGPGVAAGVAEQGRVERETAEQHPSVGAHVQRPTGAGRGGGRRGAGRPRARTRPRRPPRGPARR